MLHAAICKKDGENDKRVSDHDHKTGTYRGCAHDRCNIAYFSNRFVPVLAHNRRRYASHLTEKEASHFMLRLTSRTGA